MYDYIEIKYKEKELPSSILDRLDLITENLGGNKKSYLFSSDGLLINKETKSLFPYTGYLGCYSKAYASPPQRTSIVYNYLFKDGLVMPTWHYISVRFNYSKPKELIDSYSQ